MRLLQINRNDKILPIGSASENAIVLLNTRNSQYYLLHDSEIKYQPYRFEGKDKCDNLSNYILGIFKEESQFYSDLQFKAYKGDIKYFEQRIQNGFDAFYPINYQYSTFHYALLSKNLDLVKIFIENEVKLRKRKVIPNFNQYFEIAMYYSSEDIIKYIYAVQNIPLDEHLSNIRGYLVKNYDKTFLNDLM